MSVTQWSHKLTLKCISKLLEDDYLLSKFRFFLEYRSLIKYGKLSKVDSIEQVILWFMFVVDFFLLITRSTFNFTLLNIQKNHIKLFKILLTETIKNYRFYFNSPSFNIQGDLFSFDDVIHIQTGIKQIKVYKYKLQWNIRSWVQWYSLFQKIVLLDIFQELRQAVRRYFVLFILNKQNICGWKVTYISVIVYNGNQLIWNKYLLC